MKTPKKFTRKKEDFVCENCGFQAIGTGYTNHCPHCLWSKHVDINPGDRQATCHGLMKPVSIQVKGSGYIITHRCVKCGHTKPNRAAENDEFDAILALSTKPGI